MGSALAKSKKRRAFDPKLFLTTIDGGRTLTNYRKNDVIFSQGDPADAVFYIRKGKVKLVVASKQGKQAVVAILGEGGFFGEGCLNGQSLRLATAYTMTESELMRVQKSEMVRALHGEPAFAEMFMTHLLTPIAVLKRTWSISCSTQAKSVWHGHSFCWRILARTIRRSQSPQRSAKRHWPISLAPLDLELVSS